MLLEKRAKLLRFTQDDVISALESLFRAMLVSEHIINEAEFAHRMAFIRQTGVALAKEPYLEIEKLNLQLLFLNRLEALFTRTESYLLHGQKWCYPAEGEDWRHFDCLMSWKTFEVDELLAPQVERRIAVETERIATRIRQRLECTCGIRQPNLSLGQPTAGRASGCGLWLPLSCGAVSLGNG